MKKYLCVFGLLLSGVLLVGADRPNVVLILVDDMGWSNIGCYGGMVETPNLDRLARDGVRFDQFYNAARCCPTRATLMTGLHPHQVGIGHMTLPMANKEEAAPGESRGYFSLSPEDMADVPWQYQGYVSTDIPTLPEMLKEVGYGTYITGKWHLASENPITWPTQRGFDRFYGHLAGTSDFFDPPNLYRGNNPIRAHGERFYLTDAISENAIDFLSDHHNERPGEPFFLYLAYNAPHFPLQCMPEEYEKYRGRFMEGWDVLRGRRLDKQKEMGLVPQNTILAPRPDIVPAWDSLSLEKQNEMDAIMSTYAGMVDRVDQNIGKLIKHLERTGELDNTLIFFLSDNGGEAETGPLGQFKFEDLGQYGKGGNKYGRGWATLSNTPFREYKHYTYQGGVQTPMVVHWPDGIAERPGNRFIHQYGYLPDIVETIMDVSGATRPVTKNGRQVPKGDGVSFVSSLQGSNIPIHHDPIFVEHEGNRIARQGRWKLVSYYDKPWELFDLDADRSESNDLINKYPDIARKLEVAYDEWAERVGVISWDEAQDFSVYSIRRKKLEAANK
ncbi:MAG: arylsulfatase [Verrucomicrobia bacterium]|nr:arylsulfatase [Verrucomicrobiota bacterium]MDA1066188.1 arylsulfatase [Verrucomicrobiota bacterium]